MENTKKQIKPIWINTESVMNMIGFKRTKLSSLMKEDPTFPKPIRLTQNHIRWNINEIKKWIKEKEKSRSPKLPKEK